MQIYHHQKINDNSKIKKKIRVRRIEVRGTAAENRVSRIRS